VVTDGKSALFHKNKLLLVINDNNSIINLIVIEYHVSSLIILATIPILVHTIGISELPVEVHKCHFCSLAQLPHYPMMLFLAHPPAAQSQVTLVRPRPIFLLHLVTPSLPYRLWGVTLLAIFASDDYTLCNLVHKRHQPSSL
jgi:hypothetical protein